MYMSCYGDHHHARTHMQRADSLPLLLPDSQRPCIQATHGHRMIDFKKIKIKRPGSVVEKAIIMFQSWITVMVQTARETETENEPEMKAESMSQGQLPKSTSSNVITDNSPS